MAPFRCPFQEACGDQPREQVLGCRGWSPDPHQLCLLKTRAQVTVASLGLPRATGNQQVSACREGTELAWARGTGRLAS